MPRPHGGKLVNRVLGRKDKERALEEVKELEKLHISRDLSNDLENIAKGVYSPIEGSLNFQELENILHRERSSNDLPWTMPIVFDVHVEKNNAASEGDIIARARFPASPLE